MQETKMKQQIQKYNHQIKHSYTKENAINLYLLICLGILILGLTITTVEWPALITHYVYHILIIIAVSLAIISLIMSHHWFTNRYYKKHIPKDVLTYVLNHWNDNKQKDKLIKERIKIHKRYLKYDQDHTINLQSSNEIQKELDALEIKHYEYKQSRQALKPIKNVIVNGPSWINID